MAPLIFGWAGVFAIWIGGVNLIMRRYITANHEPWGPPDKLWVRWGFYVPPERVSLPIVAVGVLLLAVAGVLSLAA